MLKKFLYHPRKVWLRRALFQIHLWMGVLLAAYVFVIGLSGSILVFQQEIRASLLPHPAYNAATVAQVSTVLRQAHRAFPADQITFLTLPQPKAPWWVIYLADAHKKRDLAYANAATGAILHERHHLWIDWVLDFHIYLLMGETGFIVNCLAGIGLLMLALSGLVLWWPGLRAWTRGLHFSFRYRWQRVNFDAHSAVGFWTLAIVSWWGLTAIYFLFPVPVRTVVNKVSTLTNLEPAAIAMPYQAGNTIRQSLPLDTLLARVKIYSRGRVAEVGLPQKPGGELTVFTDRGAPDDFMRRDIVTINSQNGDLLSLWHYGVNHSVGDWLLWLMYPLHFGTLWGVWVKVVWALLGLSLPILSLTGLLMYWNRWLSKRMRRR